MPAMITLGFLFDNRSLFQNSYRSNIPDGINLNLMVPRDLKSPVIWSGILNLAARLCFQVISFDPPLIIHDKQKPDKGLLLGINLVDSLDLKNEPRAENSPVDACNCVIFARENEKKVIISAENPDTLGIILNCLALNPFVSPALSGVEAGKAQVLSLEPKDTLVCRLISGKRVSTCKLNGKSTGNIDLGPYFHPDSHRTVHPTAPTHLQKRTSCDWPDPLSFKGLYLSGKNELERQLNASWSIQSETLTFDIGLAVFDMISALVMEATAINLPLVAPVSKQPGHRENLPVHFIIEETEQPGVSGEERPAQESNPADNLSVSFPDGGDLVHVKGNTRAFSLYLSPWVNMALNQGGPGFSTARALRKKAAGFWAIVNEADSLKPPQPFLNPLSPIVHEFAPGSEIKDILGIISGMDKIQGKDQKKIHCEIWLSKPHSTRKKMGKTICDFLLSRGYDPVVHVFNSFKPGLCRILDYDLPMLTGKPVSQIKISFSPFGVSENQLELEHRWLHELFPIAEIVSRRLNIPEKSICLFMDKTQKETYELTAVDKNNKILFQDSFSPFYQTFDYMASHPELGTVSPVCSGIRISAKSGIFLEQAVLTDRDRFWHGFQQRVIPDLAKAMKKRLKDPDMKTRKAFFTSLLVEVCADESCYRLDFMDEQINPMETLHEDIYFFLLKFFELFSREHRLPESVKLGQILPKVSSGTKDGQVRARIEAIPELPKMVILSFPGGTTFGSAVDMLVLSGTGWALSGKLPDPEKDCNNPIGQILKAAAAKGYSCRCQNNRFSLWLDPRKLDADDPKMEPEDDMTIPEGRFLTAKEVGDHISRLGRLQNIRVWKIAGSLMNRPIHAVEAFLARGGRVSIPRLRLARPTLLINARHHANEISGTTAALKFIAFLGSDSGKSILETVNVVFIPMENMDGVATFESLHVDGSPDILHAARYNALGAEFYCEYFKYPPAFPEACAKQRLWHRWLPELMADLHGVPGHEWCQPYAGYLPKGFREFWIPRAFVYVHLPHIEDKDNPLYGKNMKVADILGTAMEKDAPVVKANKRITALYQKYARNPEPGVFSPAENTGLTVLPLLGRTADFNYAVRYPEITHSEVIVEVPDEVVSGQNLALCVKAHYRMQKALATAVGQRQVRIICLPDHKRGGIRLCVSTYGTDAGTCDD